MTVSIIIAAPSSWTVWSRFNIIQHILFLDLAKSGRTFNSPNLRVRLCAISSVKRFYKVLKQTQVINTALCQLLVLKLRHTALRICDDSLDNLLLLNMIVVVKCNSNRLRKCKHVAHYQINCCSLHIGVTPFSIWIKRILVKHDITRTGYCTNAWVLCYSNLGKKLEQTYQNPHGSALRACLY